jgi:hypothetical protein
VTRRRDADAKCTMDVVHYVNTGEQEGALKSHPARTGLREALEVDFDAIAKGEALSSAALKRLAKDAFRVGIRRVGTDPSDRKPFWYFSFKSVEAIASFKALEIYSARLKPVFPGDFRRCRSCDTFFFRSEVSKSTGNKRSVFCSESCEDDHQRATGADRKAAQRAGITVNEWRRRKAAGEST